MGNVIVEILVRGLYNLFGLDSPYSATEYGPNWTNQRRKCLERDSYQCRVCGATEAELGSEPAIHHITPRRKFAESEWRRMNALSNLITLCPTCHGTLEGKYQDASPEEFVAKSRQSF